MISRSGRHTVSRGTKKLHKNSVTRKLQKLLNYKNTNTNTVQNYETINNKNEGHPSVYVKKDVNRDSHIASSPISQSSFFKGVRCLILASSQRKLRGYIEFL